VLMAPEWLRWVPLICEMEKIWIIVVVKRTPNPGSGCAVAFIKREEVGGAVLMPRLCPGRWTMKMICESLVCQAEARIT
jgi:hypothetical protein